MTLVNYRNAAGPSFTVNYGVVRARALPVRSEDKRGA
jgi:hypothetical protein